MKNKIFRLTLLLATLLLISACAAGTGAEEKKMEKPAASTAGQASSGSGENKQENTAAGANTIPQGQTNIVFTAGNTVITARLDDSETSRAFLATLPRTLQMNRYGDREFYGRIEALPESGEKLPDFSDGDVTYYPSGPSLAIFYANEDKSSLGGLIRMGHITSDLEAFKKLNGSESFRIEIAKP